MQIVFITRAMERRGWILRGQSCKIPRDARVRGQSESKKDVREERVSKWDCEIRQRPRGIPSLGNDVYIETHQRWIANDSGLTWLAISQQSRTECPLLRRSNQLTGVRQNGAA